MRRLHTEWKKVARTLGSAEGLAHLMLFGHRSDDLGPLARLLQLETLCLKDLPTVQRLDGISEFSYLSELRIMGATRLRDVSALRAARQLRVLEIEGSRKVHDFTAVASCTNLRELNLSECGDVENIEFLRGLKQIDSLSLWSPFRVVDGNLDPIADLPGLRELRMQSRRHYRPSVGEIQDALIRK